MDGPDPVGGARSDGRDLRPFFLVGLLRRQESTPERDVWRVSWGMAAALPYLLWLGDLSLLLFWVFSGAILFVKHQKEIKVLREEHRMKKGGTYI